MIQDLQDIIHSAMRATFSRSLVFESEAAFQTAFAQELGDNERELRVAFAPPLHAAKAPPQSAIGELARRTPQIIIPPQGRDPCAQAARLDVLWHSPAGMIPIELKYVSLRKSDVYGYAFLKDLHRLERMTAAGQHRQLSDRRFAIFATTETVYWKGGRPEPEPFWIADGSRRHARSWIQYDQKAAHTLWYGYPPFYLANAYEFAWQDLGRSGRYLLVEVAPQR